MSQDPDHSTPPPSGVDETLRERGARYGKFVEHSHIAMDLKQNIRMCKNWPRLDVDMQHALDVIADKIARILNGDPNYIDNWHDIQGYAKLVEDRLRREQVPEKSV